MSQQFGDFSASELHCPKCGRSQPVRERLLLVLLDGEIREYLCARCGSSLGKRTVTGAPANPASKPASSSRTRRRLRR